MMRFIRKVAGTKNIKKMPPYLRGYSKKLPMAEKRLIKNSAEDYLAQVKRRILSQPGDVPPLTPWTLAKKKKEGLDSRMWLATKYWYKNLGITQVKKGVVFVGASKKKKHTPSGKTMAELAEIFEYGSPKDRIPPRPIFRVVNKKFKKSWIHKMRVVGGILLGSRGLHIGYPSIKKK
tara:strand:- start:3817 stop:4347 length:531 start_codon:yes stop_codon:yes gene_type:complete